MNRGSLSFLPRRLASRAALAGLAAVLLAACAGTAAPAVTDPYALAAKSFDASWDRVKVQLGVTASGADADVDIKPDAIEVVVDTKAGKGTFHLALPVSALGSEAAGLEQLGVTGDTLNVDVVYDGQALYARTPLAATLLPMLLAQTGQTVEGDLTGWLKLGTAAEFQALAALAGAGGAEASAPPVDDLSALDAAALKTKLEESGIVLAYAGTEKRNGADADHLTVTVDSAKLAASDLAKSLPADQLGSMDVTADDATLTADLWLDRSSGRPAEVDLHAVGKDGEKADITVLVSAPDSVAADAPATSTDVPVMQLLSSMMQMFGGSLQP